MTDMRNGAMHFLARFLLALIFLVSGLNRLMDWGLLTGYAASGSLPGMPLLLATLIAIEIAGGLSILIGYRARLGATLLFFYLGASTPFFHAFWLVQGSLREIQLMSFLRNLAIMGGLLELVLHGAGRASFDVEREEPPAPSQQATTRPSRIRRAS